MYTSDIIKTGTSVWLYLTSNINHRVYDGTRVTLKAIDNYGVTVDENGTIKFYPYASVDHIEVA